jgi:hypothetical protein
MSSEARRNQCLRADLGHKRFRSCMLGGSWASPMAPPLSVLAVYPQYEAARLAVPGVQLWSAEGFVIVLIRNIVETHGRLPVRIDLKSRAQIHRLPWRGGRICRAQRQGALAQLYTVEPPKVQGTNTAGTNKWAPAGEAVFSAPGNRCRSQSTLHWDRR